MADINLLREIDIYKKAHFKENNYSVWRDKLCRIIIMLKVAKKNSTEKI